MSTYSLVSLDMVLRWTEIAAMVLSVVVVAGVLLFLATVLHVTRGDPSPREQIMPTRVTRGRTAPTLPGV